MEDRIIVHRPDLRDLLDKDIQERISILEELELTEDELMQKTKSLPSQYKDHLRKLFVDRNLKVGTIRTVLDAYEKVADMDRIVSFYLQGAHEDSRFVKEFVKRFPQYEQFVKRPDDLTKIHLNLLKRERAYQTWWKNRLKELMQVDEKIQSIEKKFVGHEESMSSKLETATIIGMVAVFAAAVVYLISSPSSQLQETTGLFASPQSASIIFSIITGTAILSLFFFFHHKIR